MPLLLLLVILTTGCLDASPERERTGDAGVADGGADGGAPGADGAPGAVDSGPCTGVQYAFAYVSEVSAPLAGGSLDQVAVVQAHTGGVDLTQMSDEGPDGPSVNFFFSEVSFDEVPVGDAHGMLSEEATPLIIGGLVAEEAWTVTTHPGFGIDVNPSPTGEEGSLEVDVEVRINGASVFLPISVKWSDNVAEISGDAAAYATSECDS